MANQAKIREVAKKLNPIDDALFRKMAEDRGFCEEILRVILEDQKLVVLDNTAQWSGTNLQGRSVILDCKCETGDGHFANVEVQKSNNDDHQRRVRYHGSILTTNIADPGIDFKDVPDVIVVYIAQFDIFKMKKHSDNPFSVYHIDRIVRETGQVEENGFQEIYVNALSRDGSEVSELMQIFTEDNAYNSEKFPITSEIKGRYKKVDREEGQNMCAALDALIFEENEKVRKEVRQEMQLQFADERRQYEDERRQYENERRQERRKYEKMIAELEAKIRKQGE